MSGPTEAFAYPDSEPRILWILDGKLRRDMAPEELAQRHRKDRESYRRMRERMAVDPEYREARLAVSRATTRRHREKNPLTVSDREARRKRDRDRYAERKRELGEKRRAAYNGENAARIRANNKKWYEGNRAKVGAQQKARYRADRDELSARDRKRKRAAYAADPEVFRRRAKEWRRRDPERARLIVRISIQKRRVAAAGTSFTKDEWLAVLAEHEGRCAYCGRNGPMTIEHKIPLCRGGTNEISNIVPACRRCNSRKGKKTDAEFRTFLAEEEKGQGGVVGDGAWP